MTQLRADKIAMELEEAILRGNYKDGDRLDEATLSAEFGVSRTPLREALQKLSLSGLVEHLPRRGVFVRQPDAVELMGLFEFMAELEASCARFAAMRISDSALAELRKVNAICQKSVDENSPDEYYSSNERFHRVIYKESNNRVLEQETTRLHQRLKPYRRVQLQVRGRLRLSMKEHNDILEALAAGDAELAANTMREHVAVQGDKFYHLLSNLKEAGWTGHSVESRPVVSEL